MEQDIHSVLKAYWGYDQFRELQQEIIEQVLSGTDTLALLPTGGGKSVCYQVPAMLQEGICLVISPLIALMKDQVEQLRKKGISALAIHTGMPYKELMKTMDLAINGKIKFLYLSPERIQTKLFQEFLPELPINLLAIDEAHCISQWGYDFRPSYLQLSALRSALPKVPVLALTASATPLVQQDIIRQLDLRNAKLLKGSFAREFLSYSCFEEPNKLQKLATILKQVDGSSIVYCRSRKRTVEISRFLRDNGIPATYYHAGLPQEDRNERQQSWMTNLERVMVSTNAFGMGIDKPDVRTVVHYDVPDCLENYYQEAGRAGRDRQKAYAVLLYNQQELTELETQLMARFPSLETIRSVYRHMVHFLQIPEGTAEGLTWDFDLALFCQRFGLDRNTTIQALQVLQAEGYCALNESVFTPSKILVTANRHTLELLEKQQPASNALIKALLRNYEGLFTYPVTISESYLARLLKTETANIVQQLSALEQQSILQYEKQKDKPQLVLLAERMTASNIRINQKVQDERKKLAMARLQKMLSYITGNECRAITIGQYFGDEKMVACGICDNCLKKKKQSMPIEPITKKLLEMLRNGPLPLVQVKISMLADADEEDLWKALQWLEQSARIHIGTNGEIKLT